MRKLFRAAFYRTENKKMIRIELVIAVLLSRIHHPQRLLPDEFD